MQQTPHRTTALAPLSTLRCPRSQRARHTPSLRGRAGAAGVGGLDAADTVGSPPAAASSLWCAAACTALRCGCALGVTSVYEHRFGCERRSIFSSHRGSRITATSNYPSSPHARARVRPSRIAAPRPARPGRPAPSISAMRVCASRRFDAHGSRPALTFHRRGSRLRTCAAAVGRGQRHACVSGIEP